MRKLAGVGIGVGLFFFGLHALDEHREGILLLYVLFGSMGMATLIDEFCQAYKARLDGGEVGVAMRSTKPWWQE